MTKNLCHCWMFSKKVPKIFGNYQHKNQGVEYFLKLIAHESSALGMEEVAVASFSSKVKQICNFTQDYTQIINSL
jgi:hypothetical protein